MRRKQFVRALGISVVMLVASVDLAAAMGGGMGGGPGTGSGGGHGAGMAGGTAGMTGPQGPGATQGGHMMPGMPPEAPHPPAPHSTPGHPMPPDRTPIDPDEAPGPMPGLEPGRN